MGYFDCTYTSFCAMRNRVSFISPQLCTAGYPPSPPLVRRPQALISKFGQHTASAPKARTLQVRTSTAPRPADAGRTGRCTGHATARFLIIFPYAPSPLDPISSISHSLRTPQTRSFFCTSQVLDPPPPSSDPGPGRPSIHVSTPAPACPLRSLTPPTAAP